MPPESDNLQAALSALKYRHDLLAKLFKLISNLIRQPRMVNRDEGGHPAAMKQVMVEKIVKECAIPPIDWVEDKGFSPLPPSEE